jgi:pimeloyl-ACP methyl ester carboxylesterase
MARQASRAGSSQAEWGRFEKSVLRDSRVRATPPPTQAGVLPQVEPADDVVLRRLVERSQLMRSRSGPVGNVVFLHGITGSDLSVSEGVGQPASLWVSVPKLIFGGLRKLKLSADAKQEENSRLRVIPTGINKQFYARAVVALRAQWTVEPFAYDWRRDIDEASDSLARFIEQRFAGQPVHLVAHSMGGLVARNFIRRYPKLWKTMRDPDLIRGGRLVMLGTPNYGSFAIAQVLTGTDALLARLERFDLKNNLSELLDITNSFLGTYMLLPAHGKLPVALQRLYERSTWGPTPAISQPHLDRTFEFYKALDTEATIDPERMVYVAGVNQTTISGLKVLAPGEFEYEFTRDGDGRVPHALGLLNGVRTYYVDEVHGDLARNEQILRNLDDLLQTGTNDQMATKSAAAVRGLQEIAEPPSSRSYRSGVDRAALDILAEMAERTRAAESADVLSERDRQIAGDAFLHAALGARTDTTVRTLPVGVPVPEPAPSRRSARARKLAVRVVYGRIEDVKLPLVVVGHYRGVKPANALGAINKRLDDWIGRAVRRGMISGHVGETFFVPTRGRGIGAEGVVIAGMGDYEHFTTDALRETMANVAQGAAALRHSDVGTVLMGGGGGHLSIEQALKPLLQGFAAGVAELSEEIPDSRFSLETLHIVEADPERFLLLDQELMRLCESKAIRDVDLAHTPIHAGDRRKARLDHQKFSRTRFDRINRGEMKVPAAQAFDEVRITIECDRENNQFRFSALTDNAIVPSREIKVTVQVADETARLLAAAQGRREQTERGRVLFDYLFPRDLETLFDTDAAIRLIVDSTSAALPWEMACLPSTRPGGQPRWFGTDRRVTRQFKTLLSRSAGVILPRNETVRALVIADPAPESEWQLPGARAEGRLVARLLRDANRKTIGDTELDIVVDDFIGPDAARAVDLIGKIVSGHYDIIHFAGHGDYQKDDRTRSGWVLGANSFVTSSEILRARHAPWLIVANACYSGTVREGSPYPSLEAAERGAAIAEAFMDRGVRNYLGTGWTVDDNQAVRFASLFYGGVLQNQRLGDALAAARRAVFEDLTGSTWGAYQLYGSPNDKLLAREHAQADAEPPLKGKTRSARKPKRSANGKRRKAA